MHLVMHQKYFCSGRDRFSYYLTFKALKENFDFYLMQIAGKGIKESMTSLGRYLFMISLGRHKYKSLFTEVGNHKQMPA